MAAASNFATSRICIPVQESDEKVVIFADELPLDPSDYNDLIDVLRAEFAPLNVWRECAVSRSKPLAASKSATQILVTSLY